MCPQNDSPLANHKDGYVHITERTRAAHPGVSLIIDLNWNNVSTHVCRMQPELQLCSIKSGFTLILL